jgi:hypothetical protein
MCCDIFLGKDASGGHLLLLLLLVVLVLLRVLLLLLVRRRRSRKQPSQKSIAGTDILELELEGYCCMSASVYSSQSSNLLELCCRKEGLYI